MFGGFYCSTGLRSEILNIIQVLLSGYLENFDNARLRCFMASLHSSLYHGLFFYGIAEFFGILVLEMSRRVEEKLAIGAKELSNFSVLRLSSHKE